MSTLISGDIGPAHAFDVDIAVARAGITRFHGEVYGLGSMIKTEAEVWIGTVAEDTDETFVMTVRYRDYRSHVAVITLYKQAYPHGLSSGLGWRFAYAADRCVNAETRSIRPAQPGARFGGHGPTCPLNLTPIHS